MLPKTLPKYIESDGTASGDISTIIVPDGSITGNSLDLSGAAPAASSDTYAVLITPYAHPTYGGNNVNHGYFWERGATLGNFLWEWWSQPLAGAEYVISDGHGGTHAFLGGWDGGTTQLKVSGNIWNPIGATVVSFTSHDQVPVNTLHHTAVAWDGTNINVYLDGVLSGQTAYNGTRGNNGGQEDGILYIGGSDHSNFHGYIYRVRGFESTLPMSGLPAGYYVPQWFFDSAFGVSTAFVNAQFVADYSRPAQVVPDLSAGYNNSTHPGYLSVGNNYASYVEGDKKSDNYPTFVAKTFEQGAYAGNAPSTTPAGAIVFDEFRRIDQTPAWYNAAPTVTAPTGQTWSATCGILAENLFPWANAGTAMWIDSGVADVDVTFATGNTAVQMSYGFRRAGSNYLYVSTGINNGLYDVYLSKAGTGAGLIATASQALAANTYSTVRIVANGTSVKVYFDGVLKMDTTTSYVTGTEIGVTTNPMSRLDKIEAYAV